MMPKRSREDGAPCCFVFLRFGMVLSLISTSRALTSTDSVSSALKADTQLYPHNRERKDILPFGELIESKSCLHSTFEIQHPPLCLTPGVKGYE